MDKSRGVGLPAQARETLKAVGMTFTVHQVQVVDSHKATKIHDSY